jgi:hypothetical protein
MAAWPMLMHGPALLRPDLCAGAPVRVGAAAAGRPGPGPGPGPGETRSEQEQSTRACSVVHARAGPWRNPFHCCCSVAKQSYSSPLALQLYVSGSIGPHRSTGPSMHHHETHEPAGSRCGRKAIRHAWIWMHGSSQVQVLAIFRTACVHSDCQVGLFTTAGTFNVPSFVWWHEQTQTRPRPHACWS